MEIQQPQDQINYSQYSINETHNLIVQNIVKNQQIKFILFHRLDHIKILYRNGQQNRFLTGLVVAGRDFIKVYAIFSNQVFQLLSQHKIYQDITNIYSWQKCIVLETKQKIVGLIYQDSMLKNAFILSLQFLPLTQNDSCTCAFDKNGLFFTVSIKNFVLLCFSNAMINRYKVKPIYKENSQIISEDAKWNRSQKAYIQEIVKIKISDFQLSRIQNMNICNQSLYFIGMKNLQKSNDNGEFSQKAFYHIQTPFFFVQNSAPVCQFLAKKDNQVLSMIPYVYNKQMECLFCKKNSIYVQIQRQMVLVDEYQSQNYEIIYRSSSQNFCLWVKCGISLIKIYHRAAGNNGNKFLATTVSFDFYFDRFLLKEQISFYQGTIVYFNQNQLGILNVDLGFVKKIVNNGIEEEITLKDKNAVIIHKSFGNIADFQFSKNSIFLIENKNSIKQSSEHIEIKSKLYELKRSLITDPRPHITHGKKNYLEEQMNKYSFKSIKSIKFKLFKYQQNKYVTSNIIVAERNSIQNRYTFYQEFQNQSSKQHTGTKQNTGFQRFVNQISFYSKIQFQQRQYLIFINLQSQMWIQNQYQTENIIAKNQQQKTILPGFDSKQLSKSKASHGTSLSLPNSVFFISNFIIYSLKSQNQNKPQFALRLFDIFSKFYFDINLTIQQEIVRIMATEKKQTFKKKQKTTLVIQFTIVYKTFIQIYELNCESKELRLSYKCLNISKGLPFLSNSSGNNSQSLQNADKNRFRSVTCPQYILCQYHTNERQLYIKNSFIYNFQKKCLLILINNENQLMVYRKCLSFQNEIGYVYNRILLPLNIIKHFKYPSHDQNLIQEIGEGILKISNLIVCNGQFLEHNIHHNSYFQMGNAFWTVEKEKIKMIDIKPVVGPKQTLNKKNLRKDSKDFASGDSSNNYYTLQDNLKIMSNFIITPIRTMMSIKLMGFELAGDYCILYSRTGFQVINQKQKQLKYAWFCNLSAQNPQRKQVIINLKAFEHYIAVSYYDYILDQNTEFKSIKFKFRIYSILSKTKILQRQKSTDEPILHIKPIGTEKLLLATPSTLYLYSIKAQKILQVIRTRNISRRFALSSFSYIPQVFDQKIKAYVKPCYMLAANQFGGLSFLIGKWIENDTLRQQWFEKIRCNIRNVQLFHYGEQLKALITDQDSNLMVINLKPDRADKIADMNVGSKANVLRIRNEQDTKVYGCFEDGTIKSISAVKLDNPEVSFLDFQQESFCKQIPFIGGFNLRISRLLNQKYRTYKFVSRGNMLNCDILEEFFSMTSSLQQLICQKSELKIEQLKSIIRSI